MWEFFWEIKTYTCQGSVIWYSSSFSFIIERDTQVIKTHTPAQGEKNNKEVRIDFWSAVCFAREGQFNESTSKSSRGEKHEAETKDAFSFSRMPQAEGGRDGLHHRAWAQLSVTHSHPTGEKFSEIWAPLQVPWNIQPEAPAAATSGEGGAMFRETNMSVRSSSVQTKQSIHI